MWSRAARARPSGPGAALSIVGAAFTVVGLAMQAISAGPRPSGHFRRVPTPTLLCVPIMVQDEPTALADAQAARDAGADIVEFRIDEFFSGQTDANGRLDQTEVNET